MKNTLSKLLPTLLILMLPSVVMAAAGTTPAAGQPFYEVYDILVVDIMSGPVGKAIAAGFFGFGGWLFSRSMAIPALGSIAGGALFLGAPGIANSLGAMIL